MSVDRVLKISDVAISALALSVETRPRLSNHFPFNSMLAPSTNTRMLARRRRSKPRTTTMEGLTTRMRDQTGANRTS